MPGIVGLITKMPRQLAESQLLRMLEPLCHDAGYTSGTWVDEPLGIYVGWAVRKGSFSDGMPLRNERGEVLLVFAGEEYAEPETAQRLKERGHELAKCGPSYLVHLAEEDPEFPVGLNGRFHGLLLNLTRGTATLFNDRYGLHRIYYHESKEAFYFAAEAKAILAVRPELRKADPRSLGELVSCGCVLENRTLFESIYVLPPASVWVFGNSSLQKERRVFHAPGMGESRTSESGSLLSGASLDLLAKPPSILQWTTTNRDVADRGPGHADDYGVAKIASWVSPLLFVRRYVSGLRRRKA